MTQIEILKKKFDLYYSENSYMTAPVIREMESLSEWRTAAFYWNRLGRSSDANACIMLAEATERGNDYRSATKHLNDWVEKTVEEGIMEKDEAIKVIYPELSRIYKNHFVTKS